MRKEKKPRCLFLADLHITTTSLLDRKIGPMYFLQKMQILGCITEFIKEKEIEHVYILGDIFNKPNPTSKERISFYRYLRELVKIDSVKRVMVLLGNHDFETNGESALHELNYLLTMADMNKVAIYEHISLDRVMNANIYSWNPEGYGFQKDVHKMRFCLGHMPISRFKMSDTKVCTNGVKHSKLANQKARYCIMGHFHTPQRIGKVYYCGSPYPITFNEISKPKRVLYFNGKALISVPIATIIPDTSCPATPTLNFADITLNNSKEAIKFMKGAIKPDANRYNYIFRIKYNYRKFSDELVRHVTETLSRSTDHFEKPFYVEMIPFKEEDDGSQTVIAEVNEGNILAGIGEYVTEFWKDKKLRAKTVEILKACEEALFKIT